LISVRGLGAPLIAAIVMACGIPLPQAPRPVFWERFGPFDLEVDRFDSMREMMVASDAVVVASVRDVAVSRVIDGVQGDGLTMIRVDLAVTRVIHGASPEVVRLEFIGGLPDATAAFVDALREFKPVDPSVIFLHEKQGEGESGLYRVANSTGLWTPTSRADLDTPLRDEPPLDAGLYADELLGVDDLSQLIDLLAHYAAMGVSEGQGLEADGTAFQADGTAFRPTAVSRGG